MTLTQAAAAVPPPPDPAGRSFALLSQAGRDRLASLFRELPWIDGLMAARVIAPVGPGQADDAIDWLAFVWSRARGNEVGKLTAAQSAEINSQLVDNLCYVTDTLHNDPEAYRPYLGGVGEPVEAAASWAHGFLYGTLLCRTPWKPLFADEDALTLLLAIFCLIRDEDLPEDVSAESPYRQLPLPRRQSMRRGVVELLPNIVRSLHDHALGFSEATTPDGEGDGPRPSCLRATPRVGRNDPCPCGSGRTYKRCCLE